MGFKGGEGRARAEARAPAGTMLVIGPLSAMWA